MNNFNTHHYHRILFLLLCTLFLVNCTHHQGYSKNKVGTLRVSGENVFLNGNRASDNTAINDKDTVTTGAASSALIKFAEGGFFQLDENTDPIFILERLQSGVCIIIKMVRGQAYTETGKWCEKIETPNVPIAINSQVNIIVDRLSTEITVLEGNAEVGNLPRKKIWQSENASVSTRNGAIIVKQLSKKQLASKVAWRKKYTFPVLINKDPILPPVNPTSQVIIPNPSTGRSVPSIKPTVPSVTAPSPVRIFGAPVGSTPSRIPR